MNKIAATVLVGLAGLSGAIPAQAGKPRLVVGIVVDQLRTDYMEQLQDLFGEKGFRTLLRNGVYLRDVDYEGSVSDGSSGAAVAVTGSWPAYTGVPSALVYDPQHSRMVPPLAKVSATGAISNDSFTAEGLRLSTIADELAIATDGKAVIYSVAADPQQAVILAGHAANGAVWLNNTSGLWATSSYYGALPSQIQKTNLRGSVAQQADTMVWKPLGATTSLFADDAKKKQLFQYRFPRNDRDVYRKIAASPNGNRAVTDMAIDLIGQLPDDAGKPGVINIGYTVAPYRYSSGDMRAETTDAYLRLDAQIGRIIEAIDRRYGAGNTVIWLTGTGYYDSEATDDERFRLPGGQFSAQRAKSLLNSYLAARHGNGEYVAAIRHGNVYLSSRQLEQRNLDAADIASEARDFLAKMSGVEQTFTRGDILSPTTPETKSLNLGYDPKHGGDILIKLAPGWSMADDEAAASGNSKPMRQVPVMTPAFILAPQLPAKTITAPVEATAIAPTVADVLRIRSPNGARAKAVQLK